MKEADFWSEIFAAIFLTYCRDHILMSYLFHRFVLKLYSWKIRNSIFARVFAIAEFSCR